MRRLTTGRLIALDRDETAIEAANRRLGDYLDKVTLVHSNFSALDAVLHELGVHGVDGMLFDLGVSSPQLDEAQRGFSYKQDAPLDMRMDESAALTAREVVNTYSYEELRRILFEYGEERYAPAIAKRICQHTSIESFSGKSVGAQTGTTKADLVTSDMPGANLVGLTSVNDLVNQLVYDKVDAIVVDGAVAQQYAKSNSDLVVADVSLGEAFPYCVAVQKGDPKGLLPSINATIAKLIADGKIEQYIADAEALSDQAIAN